MSASEPPEDPNAWDPDATSGVPVGPEPEATGAGGSGGAGGWGEARVEPFAIAALVWAVVSIVIPVIGTIVAFVLAARAADVIRRSRGERTGTQYVTAARIVAGAVLALWIIGGVAFLALRDGDDSNDNVAVPTQPPSTSVAPPTTTSTTAPPTTTTTHPPVTTTLPWMNEDGELAEDELMIKLLFVWRGKLLTPPLAEGARTRTTRGRQKSAEGLNLRASVYNTLVWKVALARAGVIPPPTNNKRGALLFVESRDEGMHALRHYFSTVLQDAGVSLAGVMDFMGHSRKGSRLPMSLGVYGHTTEATYEAARTAVDRSSVPPPPRPRSTPQRNRDGTGDLAVTSMTMQRSHDLCSDQEKGVLGRSSLTPST